MEFAKKLGIYMDHSTAHVMEFTADPIESTTVESQFTHQQKVQTLSKGESTMHHAEQHQQADYYKKLGEIISHHQEVILFGPTDAKVELFNSLIADSHFSKIRIFVEKTDKMTEKEQHLFVKTHFSKH